MEEKEAFFIVRVKRPLKKATFKIFKALIPALNYRNRALRERFATAEIKSF